MKQIAMVLSGCGFLDGSEIYEATFFSLALAQKGYQVTFFAPEKEQSAVVNHLTKEVSPEQRNILVESARIARGKIQPLSQLNPKDYDALSLPGGFGIAIHLSDFVTMKDKCTVDKTLKQIILDFHKMKKAILATCITPAILAKIFENIARIKLTLGSRDEDAALLEKLGMEAEKCDVASICTDRNNGIYTTPCFMEPENLPAMFSAIQKLVACL